MFDPEEPSPTPDPPGKDMLEARLDSISVTNVGFILFLKTDDPSAPEKNRVLPIFVGANEAQSIALALNEEAPPRPLTHDLMKTMLESLEASVTRIEITDIREGTFYGRVYLERAGFEELDYDARPSDAIAMALRWEAPIFVDRRVFEEAAVPVVAALEEEEGETEDAPGGAVEVSFAEQAPEERPVTPAEKLRQDLETALREERYEEAARLRDAIKKLQLGN
jgi:bifunctional DNase/RNase